jgi:N-acetylneuraminic acid mutarotase
MNNARFDPTSYILTNGKVLVTGGANSSYLNSAELYDPSTEIWTTIGSMNDARWYRTASVLTNGKVLVTGGDNVSGTFHSAELY